jgi:hypothetical protein
MLQPAEMSWKLQHHFRSPLALKQHIQAIISAIKYMGSMVPSSKSQVPSPLMGWTVQLEDVQSKCSAMQDSVVRLFSNATGATPKTIAGYVNDVLNMTALVNVGSIFEVLTDPGHFRIELNRMCKSPYTESTYISRLLSIFKCNPQLKVAHQAAFEAWSRASAEHRAKHLRTARQNAPTNARQAANYVPMDHWRNKLSELQSQPADPHSTRQQSMSLVFLAYACALPPQRAEVGSIRVFKAHPSPPELAAAPNHVIMDSAVMRITKHKTSKHEMHSAGITEQLPSDFMQVLQDSLNRWPRDYLFVNDKDQAYTNSGFSKWVIRTTGRLFGEKCPGVSLLRHAFCSALDYNKLTGAERDALALRCGHSGPMQDQYRFLSLQLAGTTAGSNGQQQS